jgi:type I site-specific restriction endonuclease
MAPLTFPQRARLFLYSTANIAGCTLAMGGLGLYFAGIIHAYWWAIVAGLYGAAVAGWPRSELAQTAEQTELSTEMLAQQVRKLVDTVSKGLPKEALDELRNIERTLNEVLPRLQQLQDRGVISAKDSFTVLETVRRYLPDTLGAYLRLPKFYAQMQTLSQGQTAAQVLVAQLKLLNASLQEIAKNAFTGDAEKLVTNGQFLQAKFSEVTAFHP